MMTGLHDVLYIVLIGNGDLFWDIVLVRTRKKLFQSPWYWVGSILSLWWADLELLTELM